MNCEHNDFFFVEGIYLYYFFDCFNKYVVSTHNLFYIPHGVINCLGNIVDISSRQAAHVNTTI